MFFKKYSTALAVTIVSMLCLLCIAEAFTIAPRKVHVTAYALHGVTASGKVTQRGYVALSRGLLPTYPYGSTIRIVSSTCKGLPNGTRLKVQDTTAKHVYNTMDIYMPSYTAAISFGRCTATIAKA